MESKATFILASLIYTFKQDAFGRLIPMPMENVSDVLTNMKKIVQKRDSLVVIANDPTETDSNDYLFKATVESFNMTEGFNFKNYTLLDNRNADDAENIIKNADFLLLSGGKIICQKEFFERINLKTLLKDFTGLVYGFSAGAMNLCETVCNFPEEISDLPQPRLVPGLGFSKRYLIPHFDSKRCEYAFECKDFDIAKEYILPYSKKFELTALDNDAYIIMKDGKETFYGNYCFIKDEQIIKP